MKYKFAIMFMIVLCGMISIATFNPIIGPLSRTLGLSEIQSGVLVSVSGICWLLGGFYWEKKIFMSRKKMLVSIMLIYVVTLAGFGLLADYATDVVSNPSTLFWIFFCLRALAGFFFGGIPAKAQAYVMSWTTQETRTKGMALFGAANGLGFVLGPALGGLLAAVSLTAPMYAAAALLLAVATLLMLFIPDEPLEVTRRSSTSALSPNDERIRLYLLIGLALSFALNIVQVTIGFYVQDRMDYDPQRATQLIGAGLAISGVMVVASQIVISKYLRWQPKRLVTAGLTCVGLGLLGLLTLIQYSFVGFTVLGIGIGFTMLGYSAGASLAVRDHEQRSVASYIASVQGGGAFLGPLAGTMLYTAHVMFPYMFCVIMLSMLIVWVLRKSKKPLESM
ncbi:MFS transporter [Paenibacillus apiarius]|uniref:MFS transporter n=1 Tax=Paenibacillus apiarius TaxID=46240 RepID=A0ABT4DW91_9BACL|nr:MFS transporter [Paenibacillus apiarius]MCY9517720.1 MFS transporter [Paenibacillus apiarius]MCY9521627.1 MFS transporter [Paenibacillus apiarius]MCY9555305.1 MFS transporter [Paenibacillus apiarius]MCY9561185.1 MFS transporter [Paenibacillus apiarius]MCY9686328.1 MFS transporter [Paenibacillus apiarius]